MKTPSYMELSYFQVALATALILVNAGLSLLLRLDLGWRLLVAAARMVAQLLLIGVVLHWVFAVRQWYVVIALMTVMVLTAGVMAVQRTERRYPGVWLNSIVSVWSSSWVITALALFAIVQVEPWYLPQYAIPFLGMILGNTLNGISLGLDRFSDELVVHRDQVETLLALGGTRWEAARLPIQRAVRTGTVPLINAMIAAGIISLPGMMTGQLMAGVDPIEAVKYQIVIMFLITTAAALGTVSVVFLTYRRLFNANHQFLFGLIVRRAR